MAFSLPSEISSQQHPLEDGIAYVFRHKTLGELGRILLQDRADGQCQISTEVVGDPDDPMTATRRDLFLPLSQQLTEALDAGLRATGRMNQPPAQPSKAGPTATPQSPPLPQEQVASKLIPCPRCSNPAAMLVFADHAQDEGELEDYARKMYSHYKRLNVPTWILGAPRRLPDNDISCATFQVWPARGPIREMRPDEFNQAVDQIIEQHC